MKNTIRITSLSILLLCQAFKGFSQESEETMLREIEQDDQMAIDAISMYPKQTRIDIFEAAEYPEVISRLNSMQKKTREKFVQLLAPFPVEDQEKIWDMTRYPSLIAEIAADHPISENEINKILLLKYPEEIQRTATEEALKNYELLVKIDQKNKHHKTNFEELIAAYPAATANAYRNLVSLPEIMNTLFDNMQMTIIIGDLYKRDPGFVLHKTDSLNQLLIQQGKQETIDWQQSLSNNPQAMEEYRLAAEQYAQENNVDPADYATPYTIDVTDYPTYSYDWWLGYPTWYPYAYWDPYPYWFDWGFYYGPGKKPVLFGMPSAHFMNWYFYKPEHWDRFPEFGNHCYTFFDNHRTFRYSSSISVGLLNWKSRNRDIVNEDWDKDKAGRTQRFREFGQMEVSRNKYNEENPSHRMDRYAYLSQNQSKFPDVRILASASKYSEHEMQPPYTKPKVHVPPSLHQVKNPVASSVTKQSNTAQSRNAQQYHQNAWQH